MKKTLLRLSVMILLLMTSACNAPVSTSIVKNDNGPKAVSQIFVTRDPNAPATPTPFQPSGVKIGTAQPQVKNSPTPTQKWSDAPERITREIPKEIVNILLLGSDYRPESGFRTDVIMLLSINTKKGTVSVTSFPRDLYVYIPGWITQRINTAHAHGGFEMTQDTFEYNFGVRPQYYLMTNFQGFKGIIDSLGGVDVEAAQGLSDTCDLPWGSAGFCDIGAGTHHMDGQTALWYVRARHTTSDFDRTRRAQEVIKAVFVRMMRLDAVTRLPDLYQAYASSVETNMTAQDMMSLMPLASKVLQNTDMVERYAVGPNNVTPWTTEEGGAVLLPNFDTIKPLLEKAIFGDEATSQ